MQWIIERRENLRISNLTAGEKAFIEKSLATTTKQVVALRELVKAQGWDVQGGPQVMEQEDLTENPMLVTGLSHDEDNRPSWRWAFHFKPASVIDWRKQLLQEGSVNFTRL